MLLIINFILFIKLLFRDYISKQKQHVKHIANVLFAMSQLVYSHNFITLKNKRTGAFYRLGPLVLIFCAAEFIFLKLAEPKRILW